jgi:hypothetical protein
MTIKGTSIAPKPDLRSIPVRPNESDISFELTHHQMANEIGITVGIEMAPLLQVIGVLNTERESCHGILSHVH